MIKKNVRRLTLRSIDRPKPPAREKSVYVIIEVEPDFLTIYGPPHVRPIIFNRLAGHDLPGEIDLIDYYHELELPKLCRELYFPVHILRTHNIEHRTLAGEIRQRARVEMLKGFRNMAVVKGDSNK